MSVITRRALMVSGVGLATGALLSRADAATGFVDLRIGSAGFGIGGSGRLIFEGQWHLTVGGINAGALIGASAADLVGAAVHMRRLGDIAGVYSEVGPGLSIAGGRRHARLTNANGVVLVLRARQEDLSFSINLSGMTISLA
jgi:hypothetical protein